MTRVSIVGGHLIDPANGLNEPRDLHLAEGRVLATGPAPDGFAADLTLRVDGLAVCPGLVDLRARLREPGQEHKATIASETLAATAGGITRVCCPPDTLPVVDTPAVVELIHQRAQTTGHARVDVLGALTQGLKGRQLAEMAALRSAGCVGVSNAEQAVESTEVMRRAMEYAATFGLTVHLHPEDPWLSRDRIAHEGAVSTRLGLPGVPETAETVTLGRDLLLVEQTGVSAHFCHISTARGVQMIREAHARGLPVTADVEAHYLYLTEMDTADFNGDCHVRPPLRTQRDRDGLRQGIADGTLTAICSGHAPHEPDAKQAPFPATEPGISALETLLALTLRLVDDGQLDLFAAIALLSCNPASILGVEAGNLAPGRPADLCIFDPDRPWTLDPAALRSRGHNTPFAGWEFPGRVTHTLVAGRLIFEDAPRR